MKSVHVLLAEAHDKLRKDPAKMKQYREIVPITAGTPIEVQLNCATAVLAGKITEAVKNMGREHNRVTELRESVERITETERPDKTRLTKRLVESGRFTEAEAKIFTSCRGGEDALGKPCTVHEAPVPPGLTESQRTEFKFAKAIGFNDEQAMAFVKTPTRESRPNRF